jgi:LPS sulfotransferase NodH
VPLRFGYVICTVPRTGSWLLADALHRTGIAGYPEEYFREEDIADFLSDTALADDAGVRQLVGHVRQAGTTPNGLFGVKMHWSQFEDLTNRLAALPEFTGLSRSEAIERALGPVKYIYLRRADTLRQAISYYRALETDVWWSLSGSTSVPAGTLLDADRVFELESLLTSHDRAWRFYFEHARVEPMPVHYEQLVADYDGTVRAVLRYLGLQVDDVPAPRLRQQADEVSERWARLCSRRAGAESPASAAQR